MVAVERAPKPLLAQLRACGNEVSQVVRALHSIAQPSRKPLDLPALKPLNPPKPHDEEEREDGDIVLRPASPSRYCVHA